MSYLEAALIVLAVAALFRTLGVTSRTAAAAAGFRLLKVDKK